MTTRLRRHSVAAVIVLLALVLIPVNIFPCGPFFEQPLFTSTSGPDQPLDLFVKGRLGIVLPPYEWQFLVVAYRQLAGPKLTSADQDAIIASWVPKVMRFGQPSTGDVPVDDWTKARAAALGPANFANREIDPYKNVRDGWSQFLNCGNDAFLTAADTATSLAKTFGVGSETVRDWVHAQDTVFENCASTAGVRVSPQTAVELTPHIPPPATMQNAVLRRDREYQIAAANFYAGNWQAATQQFQQIAGDRESPWHIWAPYLVARCYIRQATLGKAVDSSATAANSDTSSFNAQDMTAAETQLQSILKNPALASIHPATQRLLNYVEGRLHPDQRLHQVAQQLEGKTPTTDLVQDISDFKWLLRRQSREKQLQSAAQDDLTDWVLTYAGPGDVPRSHAFDRWQATKSEAWLLAALNIAQAVDANAAQLERAAAEIAPSSPAYETAVFYRTRLLMEQGNQPAARELLDANLKRFEGGPLSSLNLLLAQRFALATDFHQFLQYAPRVPVGMTWESDVGYPPETGDNAQTKPLAKRFDGDSVVVINQRLPLTMLAQAATGDVLPKDLRDVVGTATWTRAAILNDARTAKALEAVVTAAHPELRDYLTAYDNAASNEARSFAAIWTMLHFPGMRPLVSGGPLRDTKFEEIDNYRDNWWCELGGKANYVQPAIFTWGSRWDTAGDQPKLVPPPSFLSPAERGSAESQWKELSAIGAAPNYFSSVVVQWAKTHPQDARVPEALYLVVRATRYGCTNDNTGSASKQAFDLLHTRYPESQWTNKTPYWFK
jgi:hypothetical protein